MNLNSKLVTFAQQELVLSHNDTEREKINASLRQLEKVLKDGLKGNIKEFIRFGSFTRNTILPRAYDSYSDVDLMIVFNTDSKTYTPGTYRKWLLDTIVQAYPNSISKKDFPVVKLELNHIMFDLVPAHIEDSWFQIKNYFIPGRGENWLQTVPNEINEALSSKNQNVGNNTVRNVIRLCKHWNAGAGYPFQSYLMEKDILNCTFWMGQNTYDAFLNVLNNIAGHRSGVRQALDYINQYAGGLFTNPNEQKQFEWLQKLLPGLR